MNTRRIRSRTLTALAVACLALAVAGSALAEPNQTPAPAKKGCEVQLKGPGAGQSIVYPHGYKFSVYGENDKKTHTYTCNDGQISTRRPGRQREVLWRHPAGHMI